MGVEWHHESKTGQNSLGFGKQYIADNGKYSKSGLFVWFLIYFV
jgi:hypothetical protein